MKKLVSLVLAVMMVCMLIPAMAEEDVTGDWYLTDVGGMNPADMGLTMVVTLNADGTATGKMEMAGETENQEGNWTIEGETVTVTLNDQPQEFTLADGTLQADMGGGMMGTFSREAAEASAVEFAEVNPNAQAEDFEGNWKATYMSAMGMNLPVESAVTMGQMDEIPVLSVENGKVSLKGGGLDTMFGDSGLELTFDAGKYSYSLELGETALGIDLEMLQDGTLRLTVNMGQEILLYFVKAE